MDRRHFSILRGFRKGRLLMFCIKCGSPLHENQRYCSQCGTFVGEASTTPVASATPAVSLAYKPDARTGRVLAITSLVLSGLAMLLSLALAPVVYNIFAEADTEVLISDDEIVIVMLTLFLYAAFKALGVLLGVLASASLCVLPSLCFAVTGLALGILSRAKYKIRDFKLAPILLPIGALLLQLGVIVVCFGALD